MNKEEKEAIDKIETLCKYLDVRKENYTIVPKDKRYFKTVLNLIQKQDKIIDKMAEVIEECRQNGCIESEEVDLGEIAGVQGIIEYFKKEVEKDG